MNKDFFGVQDNWLTNAINEKLKNIYGENSPFVITIDGEAARYANTLGLAMTPVLLNIGDKEKGNEKG